MKRYLYRVQLLSEPAEGVHTGRLVYMSRSAAVYRAAWLRERGVECEIRRSNPITWPRTLKDHQRFIEAIIVTLGEAS